MDNPIQGCSSPLNNKLTSPSFTTGIKKASYMVNWLLNAPTEGEIYSNYTIN